MVQQQRGIWNYMALRVVALQRPRERLLGGWTLPSERKGERKAARLGRVGMGQKIAELS